MQNQAKPSWPLLIILALTLALLCMTFLAFRRGQPVADSPATAPLPITSNPAIQAPVSSLTNIYAHNLRLHQGPNFRIYVPWLRGQLVPARKGVAPSFDDTESFYLNVTNGVVRANIGDVCNYLNATSHNTPLTDIQIAGSGNKVKITAKLHKVVTFPVELNGILQPVSGNRLEMHINKISVLKLPFKWLLGDLHLSLASFMKSGTVPGIEVSGNDIFFEPSVLLPAPHIRGTLSSVTFAGPDLQVIYGDTTKDVQRVDQWRNFLRLHDGAINFGKLTMNNVDLIMIDISQDAWFDLDLANYQAQLVNGYTRMTPQAGLQIFMPNVSTLQAKPAADISIEWFKNRNAAPPASVANKH